VRNYFTFLLYIEDERTSIGILNAKFIQSINYSIYRSGSLYPDPVSNCTHRTAPHLSFPLSPLFFMGLYSGWSSLGCVSLGVRSPSPTTSLGKNCPLPPAYRYPFSHNTALTIPSPPPTTRNTYIKSHPSTPTPIPCLFPTPHALFIEYSTPHLHSHPNQSQTLNAAGVLEASPLPLKKSPQFLYLSWKGGLWTENVSGDQIPATVRLYRL
jgi:hypothetical protein